MSRVQSVRLLLAGFLALIVSAFVSPAQAQVSISVDKSTQTMTVMVDGAVRYVWPVSTGRAGHRTPNGSWSPTRMHREYYSRKYDNAPMPHAIFFTGGYAIHGTYETGKLGRPASRGCVRLSPANARTLFALVQSEGRGNTRIAIHGTSSADTMVAQKRSKPKKTEVARAKSKPKATGSAWARAKDRGISASALGFQPRVAQPTVFSPNFWMLR
jgi:hypothetical protein